VHEIKIHVVCSKVGQGLVESRFDIFGVVLGVPKLAGDEDLLAVDTRLLDTGADLCFVAVDGSAVNVAITLLERLGDCILDFFGRCLPCAEAHGRDLGSCVEGEV